mgnify:CR=1 FL=1
MRRSIATVSLSGTLRQKLEAIAAAGFNGFELFRADFINIQNRSQMGNPELNPTSTNFGRITSQTSSLNRFYQFQARIQF